MLVKVVSAGSCPPALALFPSLCPDSLRVVVNLLPIVGSISWSDSESYETTLDGINHDDLLGAFKLNAGSYPPALAFFLSLCANSLRNWD